MKTSDTINELAGALAKAQAVIGNAHFNRTNPHFKSKFADLASVRDTITPALAANGIAVVQMTSVGDGAVIVHTRLMHSSGQWIESEYPIINDTAKPQAMGSALSYARRYSLSAICNIASEDDDDGNEAQEHGRLAPEFRNSTGTQGASKRDSRNDFTMLVTELRKATTAEAMKEWAAMRKADIEKLPPDWTAMLHEEYAAHKGSLTAKAA